MNKRYPMIGEKHGKLTVIKESFKDKYNNYHYECLCVCGANRIVSGIYLRSGEINGCHGCSFSGYKTHGMSGEPIYAVWSGTLARRRSEVCERWLSFDNFYADMHPRPEGFYLIRKDPKQKFSQENCYWSVTKSPNGIRKQVRMVPLQDKPQEIQQLCQEAADTINECYADYDKEDSLEHDIDALIAAREKEFQMQKLDALTDADNADSKLAKVEIIKRMFKEIMG